MEPQHPTTASTPETTPRNGLASLGHEKVSATRAGGVAGARPAFQRAGGGSNPTPALQPSTLFGPKELAVRPIPTIVARDLCERRHYLRSYPGGALLNMGVFVASHLLGVAVLGAGPANVHRLFRGATREQVLCLARFWLDDRLGWNTESRTLAIVLRHFRQAQSAAKAVVAYADPAAGHTGIIYQAAGFLYLGLSDCTPRYRLPDGTLCHSRSLSHRFGTRDRRYLAQRGLDVELVPQGAKMTYVALIDPGWRARLSRPVLPYRTEGDSHGCR